MADNPFAKVPPAPGTPPGEPPKDSHLPTELQGKTPDEVYDLLLAEHNREIEELKSRSAQPAQTSAPAGAPAPPYNPPYVPGGGYPGGQQEEEPDVVTNPDGFMDLQFSRRMGPLVTATVQAQRETNRRMFVAGIGKDEYEKRKPEIEALVDNLAPQMQMRPDAYDTAYNFVIAAHKDEIIEEESTKRATSKLVELLAERGLNDEEIAEAIQKVSPQKEVPRSLFSPRTGVNSTPPPVPHTERSSGGPGGRQPARKPAMTDDEKRLAAEFGMTEAEWIESRAQNTDVVSAMEAQQ